MNKSGNCYVSIEFATILRQGRFVGIAPLRFTKEGQGWRVSILPKLSYYGYAIIIITTVMIFTGMTSDLLALDQTIRMQTKMRRIVWIIDIVSLLIIAAASVFGAQTQMRAIIDCLNQVEKINLQLLNSRWPTSSGKTKTIFFYFWMTMTFFICVADSATLVLCLTSKNEQGWTSIFYCFYCILVWILRHREMNFIMVVLHIMQCFRTVNENLNNLLNGLKESRSHHKVVRCLSIAYTNTCNVVRDLNNAFGMILLLTLVSFLFHLICTPYSIFYILVKHKSDLTCHTIYVTIQSLWILYDVINLIMIVEPCHLTEAEMKTTRVLLGHLMRCAYSVDDPLAVEVNQFLKHTYLNDVSYTAMHCIPITRSLILTIFSSITTYLAILVQF